ncbi:MAG: PLP-dependent aminotransferase family protein [Burkholderiales bacterium]
MDQAVVSASSMIAELYQQSTRPRYVGVIEAIVEGVKVHRLASGQRLPTQRELAAELNMAVATVGRAYAELEKQGYLMSHVGRGTFVAVRSEESSRRTDEVGETVEMDVYRAPLPPLDDRFHAQLQRLLTLSAESVFEAVPVAGSFAHRRALTAWINSLGVEAVPDQCVITNGAQHAMMCVISELTHTGDAIATEALTDPRMKAVAERFDRRLLGIHMDADGLIPSSLEQLCLKERIAAIYVTPRCQNPTNSMLTLERRVELVAIARKHDIPIIESDIYGTLLPSGGASPIAALAPERTYFITGLARIFGPGMKIGCVISPMSDIARVRAAVGMSTGVASPILAEMAASWISDGTLEELVRWQSNEIRNRQKALERFPLLSRALSVSPSHHLWLLLPDPWRAEDFIEAAAARQVAIAPTHSFVVGRNSLPHAVRLCIGSPRTLAALELGAERLEKILSTPRRTHRDVS